MFPASDLIREYGLGQNTRVPLRALLNTEALTFYLLRQPLPQTQLLC